MNNGDPMVETKTASLPPPTTGTARQSVQLPRNWAEMLERWQREGNVREMVMEAIRTYVMVYGEQIREEKTEDGRTIPILARSRMGNDLLRFAESRKVHSAALLHLAATVVVQLLSEKMGDESLFDLVRQSAKLSKREFADEVAVRLAQTFQ